MEHIVISFKNSLSEIMIERDINIVQLGREINADPSILHRWFDSVNDVKLKRSLSLQIILNAQLNIYVVKLMNIKNSIRSLVENLA